MIKIQNTKGEVLTLGKKRLYMLPTGDETTTYYVLLKDLDVVLETPWPEEVSGYCTDCDKQSIAPCIWFEVDIENQTIGCCTFNNKTWKAIVKAAKAARPKKASR